MFFIVLLFFNVQHKDKSLFFFFRPKHVETAIFDDEMGVLGLRKWIFTND